MIVREIVRDCIRDAVRASIRETSLSRLFATLNGTSQSATLNAAMALASGDTATFITYPTDIVAARYLCDSDVVDAASLPVYTAATTGFYNWPAGLVSSATLNGVTIANSTAAPALGKKNTLILTLSAAARIAKVGIAQAGTGWFKGQYDTITHTPISTGIPIVYELSSGSLTTQYAKGFASPSANFLTLTNFQSTPPASWELMTRDNAGALWYGSNRIVNGTFNGDTTGWTAYASTVTWVDGRIRVQGIAGGFQSAYQTAAVQPGTHRVAVSIEAADGTTSIGVYNTAVASVPLTLTDISGTRLVTPPSSSNYLGEFTSLDNNVTINLIVDTATGDGYFDNVSVYKILKDA